MNIKNILNKFTSFKNIATSLAVVLVASFVIPSSVFASESFEQQPTNSESQTQILQVVTQPIQSSSQVTVSNISGCGVVNTQTTNFVQDQPIVNLNNSSACSSLEVEKITVTRTLSVQDNVQNNSSVVVVRLPESRFNSALENHKPFEPLAVITIVVSFVVAALYEERKRFAAFVSTYVAERKFIKQPVLAELSVWRC